MGIEEAVGLTLCLVYLAGMAYLFGRISGYTKGWEAAKQTFCTWHKTDKKGG